MAAIFNSGTLTVSDSTLSRNSGHLNGGAILTNGTATLGNSRLSGNRASAAWAGGGAIYNTGLVTVSHSSFADNSVGLSGGAIVSFGGTHQNCQKHLLQQLRGDHGGAIQNYGGPVTVTNSTLSNNSARDGGAIASGGANLSVTSSTLSNNLGKTERRSITTEPAWRLRTTPSPTITPRTATLAARPSSTRAH